MADYTPDDVRIAALAEATGVSEAALLSRAQEIRDDKAAEIRADLGIPEPGSVEEAIGVVLANTTAVTGETYLDSFEAQELAAVLMVDQLVDEHSADVARLTRELDDERGSHAMTRQHFTDYAEDKQAEVARLTQLLAAAQLDRDQAQADARAALARAEQLAGVLAEVLKRMWNECNDAGFVSFRTEWVPAATVAEWRWVLAGPVDGDG